MHHALFGLRIFGIGAGWYPIVMLEPLSVRPSRSCPDTPTQKSVIWWASKHRHLLTICIPQHRARRTFAAAPRFIYSHLGWIFSNTRPDFAKVSI